MPLYEYTCRKCHASFEALVFDAEAVECPECHGKRVERLLSVPAKPRVRESGLPMAGCKTDAPPCGPGCCRL